VSNTDGFPRGEEAEAATDPEARSGLARLPRGVAARLIAALAALLAVAAICGVLFLRGKAGGRRGASSSPSLATSGGAPQTLLLKGMTAAVTARSIQAPLIAGQQFSALTITKLIPRGTRVKRGDLLVEFDRQAQARDFIDKQAQSDNESQKVIEEQAKEAAARAKDETEIRQAEDALAKAKLEMEKVELLSRIDAEKAREELDEAEATLTQLKATFNLKRVAAQAAIRILEIQRDRTRETMLHAQANSALMQIHSPIDGIVVFNTIWKEGNTGEVQEGDQVRPGVPFMQVVDLPSWRFGVRATSRICPACESGSRRLCIWMPIAIWCFRVDWNPSIRWARLAISLQSYAASPPHFLLVVTSRD